MRVVAGQAGGLPLRAPRRGGVRPTSDRVRQALMDILLPWIPQRYWLDLFAGSGAVGIEALSRGAARVVFVEQRREACRVIEENLRRTGLHPRAEVRCQPVEATLPGLLAEGWRFDVIFADPPYDLPPERLATLGCLAGLLAGGGVVALERSRRRRPPQWDGLRQVRESRYGETCIHFFVRETEPSPWP